MRILGVYKKGPGQKLNTSLEQKLEILRLSGLSKSHRIDTYLWLPSFVGRSKEQAFSYIKDRVWNKISNWKLKFLSQASKEVLLKSVIQAIPTYCMGFFKLPITLCKDINSLMQNFWW
jgi:hypothetical protein